jgi:uncharacterized protein YfaP (DUF2135 family)
MNSIAATSAPCPIASAVARAAAARRKDKAAAPPCGQHTGQGERQLRQHAERPFRADEQPEEVIARRTLARAIAEPQHVARAGHDGGRADVVARAAVLDRVDAARVVRDHAADRRPVGAPAGRRRKEEAVRPEVAVQLGVDDARLDVDLQVVRADGHHARHARAIEHDAAADGDRIALEVTRAARRADTGVDAARTPPPRRRSRGYTTVVVGALV